MVYEELVIVAICASVFCLQLCWGLYKALHFLNVERKENDKLRERVAKLDNELEDEKRFIALLLSGGRPIVDFKYLLDGDFELSLDPKAGINDVIDNDIK